MNIHMCFYVCFPASIINLWCLLIYIVMFSQNVGEHNLIFLFKVNRVYHYFVLFNIPCDQSSFFRRVVSLDLSHGQLKKAFDVFIIAFS